MARRKNRSGKPGEKVRVPFRRNRSGRTRRTDLTRQVRDAEGFELDLDRSESVTAKGALSRQRTVRVQDDSAADEMRRGVAVAVRGLFVDVDDGERVWPCTVRRVLRTRLIEERGPITVGDRVGFRAEPASEEDVPEGVIESVAPRQSVLRRRVDKRIHTIAANVDQCLIVTSAAEPAPKPHLIDRYAASCEAGGIRPIVCMNKTDLDTDDAGPALLNLYASLGYATLSTSAVTGQGIEALRGVLRGNSTVIAGQSGVGKSSLLNAVEPGLNLRIGDVIEQTEKGRHTTTTATLIRLKLGGYVVDTPGVRSFDTSLITRNELEACFVEFVPLVAKCKFPDCTHIHETGCAVKAAVEGGEVHVQRYESYVQMFDESGKTSY